MFRWSFELQVKIPALDRLLDYLEVQKQAEIDRLNSTLSNSTDDLATVVTKEA